jgi:hypothetical protein
LESRIGEVAGEISELETTVKPRPTTQTEVPVGSSEASGTGEGINFFALRHAVFEVRSEMRANVLAALAAARNKLAEVEVRCQEGMWRVAVNKAKEDAARYLSELAELGIDPMTYERVRAQLASETDVLADLDRRIGGLSELADAVTSAWSQVENLLDRRFGDRRQLLDEIAERSALLRFTLLPKADVKKWTTRIRELLNLRADGFLEDVPALGEWLWGISDEGECVRRTRLWRSACVTGDFGTSLLRCRCGRRGISA